MIDATDELGRTPLFLAAKDNNLEMVRFLLKSRAGINVQDNDGQTLLHLAVKEKKREITQLLLYCNAKVNTQDNLGQTSLHLALENKDFTMAEYLIKEKGALANITNNKGENAWGIAKRQGASDDFLKMLLSEGDKQKFNRMASQKLSEELKKLSSSKKKNNTTKKRGNTGTPTLSLGG